MSISGHQDSDRQHDTPRLAEPAGTASVSSTTPLSWSQQMEEMDRMHRRMLLRRGIGILLLVLALSLALFFLLNRQPANETAAFDFRGISMRSPLQSGLVAVEDHSYPGLQCYRKQDEPLVLLGLPLGDVRYFYDDTDHLLRRIEIDMPALELGMNSTETIDRAMADKFGELYPVGGIKTNLQDGARGLSQAKKATLPAMRVAIHIQQDCVASQREGSGVYEMIPTSSCKGSLVFSDTTWVKKAAEAKPDAGL